MKLYNFWRSTSSYRTRIALHFKQVPFEYVAVNLTKGDQRLPEHVARNPVSSVPVLEVEENGKTYELAQSVAIVEYVEERFPERPLFPKNLIARAEVRAIAELVNSGIQPLHNLAVLNHVRDELKADEKKWAAMWTTKGLLALEAIAKRTSGTFLVGDEFTWADCCMVAQLLGARRFGADFSALPTLVRIDETCQNLEWVKKAKPENQPDAVAS